jgi:crotonobetainyl-CoA:carnitine CoA-transferase CaiB-like acyl-CoA transferase
MQISMLTYLAAWELNGGTAPGRSASGAHPSIVPAQTFATRDGYVSVFVGNDEIWRRLVGALSQPELRDDRFADGQGRYRNRGELVAVLESVFSEWSVADLVRVLRDHRVPCAPVNSVSDALEDPQVADRGMVVPVEHPGYGTYRVARGPIGLVPAPTTGAPVLGQDSKAILLDSGFSDAEVDDLIADGVVVQAGESSHTSNRE